MTSTSISSEPSTYVLGHQNQCTVAHGRRTAVKCAGFVIPHIKTHMRILDIGCGPGSITADLAAHVPQGSVVGTDVAAAPILEAEALALERKLGNLDFRIGDVLAGLDFDDESFDIVYSHQLLPHLSDPIAALKEMKRVCKKGGLMTTRNHIQTLWYPPLAALRKHDAMAFAGAKQAGAFQPNAGLYADTWARQAGFDPAGIETRINGFLNNDEASKANLRAIAEETLEETSTFRKLVLEEGSFKEQDFEEVAVAMRDWEATAGSWHTMVCAELICHV